MCWIFALPEGRSESRLWGRILQTSNNPKDVLARTLWGEARGEGIEGMVAVANVVMNRVKANRWANDIIGVIMQPKQFSVWNLGDPNRPLMQRVTERDKQFRQALEIADKALSDDLDDITNGADHYHTRAVSPRWSRGQTPVARIGRHVFFRLG